MQIFILFVIVPFLSLLIFLLPKRNKSIFAIAMLAVGALSSLSLAFMAPYTHTYSFDFISPILYIDGLGVLFIILLNITAVTAFLYSRKYIAEYEQVKTSAELSLHWVAYVWFYVSMCAVIMFRDTATFLTAWELMTGASFLLIIFEAQKPSKLKIGIMYLVQMHICLFLLIAGFSVAEIGSDKTGFDAVAEYFGKNSNFWLFVLFLAGFGYKAGFVPLHTWVADLYPSASGNVTGFMSGTAIKMGIYGIARVISSLKTDIFECAVLLLVVSAITALYGIAMALMQKDIKRLLAYSSIENIGIIGIGLAAGMLGTAWGNTVLAFAGYSGALLHTFNHSLFKPVLFFTASWVCRTAHTQDMNNMGGVAKKMPYTTALFLISSVAACALPPLNGFISEFLIYSGLFSSLSDNAFRNFATLGSVITLAITGGLSVIAFTKAFGITFLGVPRTKEVEYSETKEMWQPLIVPLVFMLFIGIFPEFSVDMLSGTIKALFGADINVRINDIAVSLRSISLVIFLFAGIIFAVVTIRKKRYENREVNEGPTWGCGYTAPNAKMQYTAASFVSDFEHLANPVTKYRRVMEPIEANDLFPEQRVFKGEEHDLIHNKLVSVPFTWVRNKFYRLSVFQTGKIRHYVSFALLFMLVIFVLSYLGFI